VIRVLNKVITSLIVTTIIILLLQGLSATIVYAAPQISGYMSGPKKVAYGNSFSISITIKNYGDKTAYLCSIVLNVPAGFSASKNRIYVGDLGPGKSKTYSVSVTAPKYLTTGTFTATVFYSDNPWGKSTSLAGYISPLTVRVERGYVITFVILSTKGQIDSAIVSVYDSSNKFVTGGGGQPTGSTSPVYVQVNLLYGEYLASAAGNVWTTSGLRNLFGSARFTADKDKFIIINLRLVVP